MAVISVTIVGNSLLLEDTNQRSLKRKHMKMKYISKKKKKDLMEIYLQKYRIQLLLIID
jgi:hypothetical protein